MTGQIWDTFWHILLSNYRTLHKHRQIINRNRKLLYSLPAKIFLQSNTKYKFFSIKTTKVLKFTFLFDKKVSWVHLFPPTKSRQATFYSPNSTSGLDWKANSWRFLWRWKYDLEVTRNIVGWWYNISEQKHRRTQKW